MITIIAAVARNRAIGYQNKLLYWLPNDMKRFRLLTTGHTIVMGRRTYESLPNGALPQRRNCVLSRSVSELPGCECFSSWQDFVDTCQPDEHVFIIGGATLYSQLLDKADQLCLTEVDDSPELADAFFPDYSHWQQSAREDHAPDQRHQYAYSFVDYTRPQPSQHQADR